MEFEEDDIVLGTVEKIESMAVFVKLENDQIGTIVISEIAPGRIKNLREYVSPNKVIVCKIIRINNERIDLSLRRVSAKEKQEALARHKRERDIKMGMKTLLGKDYETINKKIKEDFKNLTEFVETVQEDKELLEEYIPKEYFKQIEKLTEVKKKEVEIKTLIKLKCFNSDGLKRIKELFEELNEGFKITYISAGNYQVNLKAEDYKKANNIMQQFTSELEKKSKKLSCELLIEEKK